MSDLSNALQRDLGFIDGHRPGPSGRPSEGTAAL
jgi:hypothetical protein